MVHREFNSWLTLIARADTVTSTNWPLRLVSRKYARGNQRKSNNQTIKGGRDERPPRGIRQRSFPLGYATLAFATIPVIQEIPNNDLKSNNSSFKRHCAKLNVADQKTYPWHLLIEKTVSSTCGGRKKKGHREFHESR
jgi:hypothetical protein